MITTPDLLISIGGVVCLASIWSQVHRNHMQQSAKETSWIFLYSYSIALMLFIIGKLMVGLMWAAGLDILCLFAFLTIFRQKLGCWGE